MNTNNILFFLTPKAMCAYLYDDYTMRQALEKMGVLSEFTKTLKQYEA